MDEYLGAAIGLVRDERGMSWERLQQHAREYREDMAPDSRLAVRRCRTRDGGGAWAFHKTARPAPQRVAEPCS